MPNNYCSYAVRGLACKLAKFSACRAKCKTTIKMVISLYQLSWKCKLATVMSYKADVSSVSPSSEQNDKL